MAKARTENKNKLGNIDVDSSKIKSKVETMTDKNREEVQQQKVDTRKEAQQIKDGVDEMENSRFLSEVGIGTKNPNQGKKYDE